MITERDAKWNQEEMQDADLLRQGNVLQAVAKPT